MFELFFAFVVAAFLGAVGGAVAAFTHQAFITKAVAKATAEYQKLEALKAKL